MEQSMKMELERLRLQVRQQKRKLEEQARQEEKSRRLEEIMGILSHHVGRSKAIGMGELYVKVFDRQWLHRINDTRAIRRDIEGLRTMGRKICYSTTSTGGGYYIAATDDEWKTFIFGDIRKRAMSIKRDRIMYRISNEEAMRQIQIVLEGAA